MILSIIVAYDLNQGIGINNTLPWRLTDDLKFFKKTTLNKAIIMGRNTYDSIGKPLPNRRNIILSRQTKIITGCEVYSSMQQALSPLKAEAEVFIIGGASIYKQYLPMANRLYITRINTQVNADTFFPKWDKSQYHKRSTEHFQQSDKNQYDFDIEIWEKVI